LNKQKSKIYGFGEMERDYIYVEDVAEAAFHLSLLQKTVEWYENREEKQ